MSSAAVEGRADAGIHRRVEHVMGMPISLAMRGRYAATPEADRAWQSVINQLREVDQIFSTYREDSVINRLDRGELAPEQCPAEVAEVLQLGREAEQLSAGAFSIMLPSASGRRRLDPSGVVKGWGLQRASQFLAPLDDTDYCLSGGGDIICRTADLSRPEWRIGIEHPHNPKALIAVVPIRSGAIATSGTAHRGAHLIDPRTGRAPSGIASVSVIEASLTGADIDATAAYVHGRDAVRWLQDRPIRSALIVWADGTTTRLPADLITNSQRE